MWSSVRVDDPNRVGIFEGHCHVARGLKNLKWEWHDDARNARQVSLDFRISRQTAVDVLLFFADARLCGISLPSTMPCPAGTPSRA